MSNEDPTPPPPNRFATPPQATPPGYQQGQAPGQGPGQGPSIIDSMIPTKNGDALLSYYLGIFSIIPCAGLIMGPIAFMTGRRGLKAVKATPGLAGKTHAAVGIGCGSIGFLFNLAIVLLLLAGLIFGKH